MKPDRRRLLAKVAYLYYMENLSQTQIAQRLGIYRTTISRMLKQAKSAGIVKIEIADFDSQLFELEEYVKGKYHLKYLEVVPSALHPSEVEILEAVSTCAASLLRSLAEKGQIIGVSWGQTLSQVVQKIEPKHFQQIRICPLAGGPSHINSSYHVNTLVYELARKFHGESTFINATVLQETKELAQGILRSKYFQETLDYWNRLDIAVMGVGGNMSQVSSQWQDLLTPADRQRLVEEAAVGESCCRFFNTAGEVVYEKLQERIIAIPFANLAKTPISLGVAYGANKSPAILALIKNGTLNSLVTDQDTLLRMLAADGDERFS